MLLPLNSMGNNLSYDGREYSVEVWHWKRCGRKNFEEHQNTFFLTAI